jgi:hypothetical protein
MPDPLSIIDFRNPPHPTTDGPFAIHAIASADSGTEDDTAYDSCDSHSDDHSVHVNSADFSAFIDDFLAAQPAEYEDYYYH